MAQFTLRGAQFEVGPHVVAGTDRGGEDLFVRLTGKAEAEPPTAYGREEVASALFSANREHCEFREYDPDEGVEATSDHYDFAYEATWDDFVDLVTQLLNEGDWKHSRKAKTWTLESDHYVDGNAD